MGDNHLVLCDMKDELALFEYIYYEEKRNESNNSAAAGYQASRSPIYIQSSPWYARYPFGYGGHTTVVNNYGAGSVSQGSKDKEKEEKKKSDSDSKLVGALLLVGALIGATYYVASYSDYLLMYRSNILDQLNRLEQSDFRNQSNQYSNVRLSGKEWIKTFNKRSGKTFNGFIGMVLGSLGVGYSIFTNNTDSAYVCLAGAVLSGCYMMYNSLTSSLVKEKREYYVFKLSLMDSEPNQNRWEI